MSGEKSYVIGTQESEIARLGVQHRVWRSSVLELWQKAGITEGQCVLDCGAGPGYATIDLAEIVGANGNVTAVERSRRFVEHIRMSGAARALANVEPVEADLLDYDWPHARFDHVWCRWVLAFVSHPARIVGGMARTLKPGGTAVVQEYWDYASWRLAPPSPPFEDYVARIIAHWRASSCEPDIGLSLPQLFAAEGLILDYVRPVVFTARMNEFASRWPQGFARDYLVAMRDAGRISANEQAELADLLDRRDADPDGLVITPGVLQFIFRKTV